MRICVYTHRRLQEIVIDCKRNLQQRQRTLYKKILSVHILQVHPHTKIGCTPVRLTWEDHLLSVFHSEEFDEQASITSLSVLGCCSVHELRGIWLSDLVFPGLSVALGLSDNENFFTVLINIHPHHHKSPRAYHEFSTFVRRLSYVDIAWLVGLVNSSSSEISEEYGSHRACLSTLSLDRIAGWWSIPYGSHRSCLSTLSLDTVEDVMVGEVDELEEDVGWSISCLEGVMDVEEGKLEGGVVDKPGTIIATCFTCNRRRKSACWTNSWQVFPNIFRSNFGEHRLCWCAMTFCFGGWWKPVWLSKKVFLNFSSNLDDTVSSWMFWEPELLQ